MYIYIYTYIYIYVHTCICILNRYMSEYRAHKGIRSRSPCTGNIYAYIHIHIHARIYIYWNSASSLNSVFWCTTLSLFRLRYITWDSIKRDCTRWNDISWVKYCVVRRGSERQDHFSVFQMGWDQFSRYRAVRRSSGRQKHLRWYRWRRHIGCLIFIGHFPQKSPVISDSCAERDLQLEVPYALSPPSIRWRRGKRG